MIDQPTRQAMSAAPTRLSERVRAPRVVVFSLSDQALLRTAIERIRTQWLGPSQPLLTVALAGGTGVGKSTLINALAGQIIAEASEIRPTTRHIQVYHHREDSLGSLPAEAAEEATFVAHDRPELRLKLLVDAPDLDSFVVRHRETTKALLRRSGLVLYVFSPERYLEERTWSVLRQETVFSACAAVLNKADRAGSPDELEQITEDLRDHFAELGLREIRIFRVSARAHVPEASGPQENHSSRVDEMAALRAFIERELHASEIARLLREQRAAGIAHLRAELDRVAPETTLERMTAVGQAAQARAPRASERLLAALSEPFAALEAELAPRAALHRHGQFWGPFRVWLALADFFSFGLTNLLKRSFERVPAEGSSAIADLFARSGTLIAHEILRDEADALQDLVFSSGLPVERWRAITADVDGPRLITEIAGDIERNLDASFIKMAGRGHSIVWAASTLGGLVPSALVVIGLVVMTRDIVHGNYVGLPLLGHLVAMVVLFFLTLQGIVSALLPGTGWIGPSLGPDAVHRVLKRTLMGWSAAYRSELAADLADLREPLSAIHAFAEGPGVLPGPQTPKIGSNSPGPSPESR